jgi:hypothetical protein
MVLGSVSATPLGPARLPEPAGAVPERVEVLEERESPAVNSLGKDREKLGIRHRPMSSWSLLVSAPDTGAMGLRQAWQALVDSSDDPFAIYQSPFWFDAMKEEAGGAGAPHALAVRRDDHHRLIGIVPLFVTRERCLFPLARGYAHKTARREVITLPSGRLLIPPGTEWFDAFFAALGRRYLRRPAVKIENIPIPSLMHDYLRSSELIGQRYFLHEVPYLDRVHTIRLPARYDEFLARYSAKKRYNLVHPEVACANSTPTQVVV